MPYKCLYFKKKQRQGKPCFYCTKKQTVIELSCCYSCSNKEYKSSQLKKISKTNKIVKQLLFLKQLN